MKTKELAAELRWLGKPENQLKPAYSRRLSELYAYAAMVRNKFLFEYLEVRYRKVEVVDKTINIILKQAE